MFGDFGVAWLVTARNHRRKVDLPLGWREAFPPLKENLGNWAVLLWEVQGIYRSSVNCIFFHGLVTENVVVKYWNKLIRAVVGPPSLEMPEQALGNPLQGVLSRSR